MTIYKARIEKVSPFIYVLCERVLNESTYTKGGGLGGCVAQWNILPNGRLRGEKRTYIRQELKIQDLVARILGH